MWVESISYIIAFVVSAGMTVIGIMVSYQNYQFYKKPVFATLLYHQIFLFSFFIYSIWGNTALRLIIRDLNLSAELIEKLAVFIPIIGIPFMVVSWFMLLKFAFNLNGYKFSKAFIYAYFPTLVVFVFTLAILIQKEILLIPADPDLFVVRILVVLNFLIHIFFTLAFIKPKRNAPLLKESGFNKKWAIFFLLCVVAYSVIMSFFNIYGFISICISIILLFASGVFIPVKIWMHSLTQETTRNIDFDAFCKLYEISKREAEIILEICSGKPNKAIAEKLFITLQTVKDHNYRIFSKIGVKSRVQLTNMVREKTGEFSNR
ncbi:LuxR C-terminal-related transcriptional regulator [Prolixibacteraceae bacterium Z1-6]|uniref:LuxR C-terminal-related transcriptional regulator n=1 Tax=Draconibacterium aestuarii TaxID=2998507 RepID=A0A9X3F8B6_9BACT|nr:LuxR C-terminal-related transcriptional regulator [Prolixibacteraceae bacterium Z1-6]